MKKIFFGIFAIIIAVSIFSCDPSKKALKSVDKSKIDTTYTIKVGEKIEISMNANPSTGYKWTSVKPIDTKILKFDKQEYVADKNPQNMVGKGGNEVWTYTTVGKGKAYIHFKYVRPNDEAGKIQGEKFIEFIVK